MEIPKDFEESRDAPESYGLLNELASSKFSILEYEKILDYEFESLFNNSLFKLPISLRSLFYLRREKPDKWLQRGRDNNLGPLRKEARVLMAGPPCLHNLPSPIFGGSLPSKWFRRQNHQNLDPGGPQRGSYSVRSPGGSKLIGGYCKLQIFNKWLLRQDSVCVGSRETGI